MQPHFVWCPSSIREKTHAMNFNAISATTFTKDPFEAALG
jgi:hypothetical protein